MNPVPCNAYLLNLVRGLATDEDTFKKFEQFSTIQQLIQNSFGI